MIYVFISRPKLHLQVEYFDQLRDKYHQVKEKVDIYSRKCSHLEERLRSLNTKPVIKPKVIEARPYKPKKVVGKENSLGVYEDLVDDPTIPKGWSSALKTMSEAFGDDVKAVVYLFHLLLSLLSSFVFLCEIINSRATIQRQTFEVILISYKTQNLRIF